MTSQHSARIKARILGTLVLSLAGLAVLLAFAAPAQQAETGKSAKSSTVSVPAQASMPAVAMPPVPQKAQDSPVSFLPAVSYNSGGIFALSLAVGDVNGDGKPDLVVANQAQDVLNHGSVGILLGNGDGTFHAVLNYDSGDDNTTAVAIADVNGDGKPDLLVSNVGTTAGSTVGVLLGNGDGTFQAAVTYASGGNYAFSVAVADVNGDGKPDLVVANCSPGCFTTGVVSVLLATETGRSSLR
jgi:hypothetical protein